MSDLPTLPSPTPLSPGKQLALEAGLTFIGVAGVALSCLCLWWLWRSIGGTGGGGTELRRRVARELDVDAAPAPPAHEQEPRREARRVVVAVVARPGEPQPFIIPGRGEA